VTERNEQNRHMQQKDEELCRCRLEISRLRRSVESCTRQRLILQPQEDLKDSDIASRYQDLCSAIEDWEDIQFGDLDNPIENFQPTGFGPGRINLAQEYLGNHGEANIASKHPSTGNTMLTYMVHCHLQTAILDEKICWPSLNPDMKKFVSFIQRGMRTANPPRGTITLPSFHKH
jgi:hypothetical protein